METLRHLLSFTYDRGSNQYKPIKVWENPHDESDFLVMTQLAGRRARHKDFNAIAGTCGIVVGADGHCQRDTVELINTMYSRYKGAMRSNFSSSRPAQPVLYLDATGASLGRGVTHAEVGSADFDGDAKQSRSSLVPLALYEGSDKAVPLREYLDLVIPSYNRLIRLCEIKVDGVSVPCQPITSADMQGTKSFFGMCSSSHPVWCKCQKGIDQQHKYPSSPSTTYEEMLSYCEEEVGCEIKSYEEMCCLAHYSPGVARGGAFTPFTCPCCGYKPTERKWRADLAFLQLNVRRRAEGGSRTAQRDGAG